MNYFRTDKRGFSLVELSASVVILFIAMGLAVGGFLYALKNTTAGDVQSELDVDVQLAMERLKRDLRLSSLDKIFYHPAGAGPYLALSFPMARDDDGDGLFELGIDGKIIWDQTLVYHIWPSSPHQLRVTTFDPRDNSLTDAQRQAQLESVVQYGHGRNTFNGANATSDVIFENLLDWTIVPQQSRYDAYSPVLKKERASLGYTLLGPGSHTFTFKVIGKHDSSIGYKIGLDQLVVSPSYGLREAEAQLPVQSQVGAVAVAQYMGSGSWQGNYQLLFPATAVDQSFTLSLDNDRWEETNFGGVGYVSSNTVVEFAEDLSPKDYVVRLAGMDETWQASLQSGSDYPTDTAGGQLDNAVVRVLLKGADLENGGNWLSYNGEQCWLTFQASSAGSFKVMRAYIGESASATNASLDFLDISDSSKFQLVRFGGSTIFDISNGAAITSDAINLQIDKTKSYVVSFRVVNDSTRDAPMQWLDNRVITEGAAPSTCVMTNAPLGAVFAQSLYGAGVMTNRIFGLRSVKCSYPEQGTYISQIFDTHMDAPVYGDITWNADTPGSSSLSIKVRTGDQPDLSDAADWSALTEYSSSPQLIGAAYKRYVQFQALLESDSIGSVTPTLKDVSIEWNGPSRMVNIGAVFTKGPDYGRVEVSVDGKPVQSALTIDLEIYKDILTMNKGTKRVTSSLVTDIRPRNTDK